MGPRAVTIDLSIDELHTLLGLLQRDLPAWVDATAVVGLSEEARSAVEATAGRSLVARGMVDVDGRVATPIAALLEILAAPELVVSVASNRDTTRRVFTCGPAIAIDHESSPGLLHRLVAFPTEDLALRLAASAGLDSQPRAQGPPFRVNRSVAAAALEDPSGAERVLLAGGAPPGPSAAVAQALVGSGARVIEATWLERVGRVVGGQSAWVDGGPAGLWAIDPGVMLGGGRTAVDLTPTSAAEVLDEIRSYLPGG